MIYISSTFRLQIKKREIKDQPKGKERSGMRIRTYKRITKGGQRVRSESTDTYVTSGECTIFDSAILPFSLSLSVCVFEVRVYFTRSSYRVGFSLGYFESLTLLLLQGTSQSRFFFHSSRCGMAHSDLYTRAPSSANP